MNNTVYDTTHAPWRQIQKVDWFGPQISSVVIFQDNTWLQKNKLNEDSHSCWLNWIEPTQLTSTNMALEETNATVMLGSSKLLSKLKTFLYNSGIFPWKEQTFQLGRFSSSIICITRRIISEKEPLEFHIAVYSGHFTSPINKPSLWRQARGTCPRAVTTHA